MRWVARASCLPSHPFFLQRASAPARPAGAAALSAISELAIQCRGWRRRSRIAAVGLCPETAFLAAVVGSVSGRGRGGNHVQELKGRASVQVTSRWDWRVRVSMTPVRRDFERFSRFAPKCRKPLETRHFLHSRARLGNRRSIQLSYGDVAGPPAPDSPDLSGQRDRTACARFFRVNGCVAGCTRGCAQRNSQSDRRRAEPDGMRHFALMCNPARYGCCAVRWAASRNHVRIRGNRAGRNKKSTAPWK
jgi:hypothetical protein